MQPAQTSRPLFSTKPPETQEKPSLLQRIRPHLLTITLSILLVASVASSVYLYREVGSLKAEQTTAKNDEVPELVAKVGKLMLLPDDEAPTVATVSDPSKLTEQAFFAHAKTGDKVLIYTKAKKAILYDVDENKIIEVAPINIGESEPTEPKQ